MSSHVSRFIPERNKLQGDVSPWMFGSSLHSLRPRPANFLMAGAGADAYFILGDRECRAVIEWMKAIFEGIILAQRAIFAWSELLPNHTVRGGGGS